MPHRAAGSDQLTATALMSREVAELVLPDELRKQIEQSFRLVVNPTSMKSALAETDILITSWGAPQLTAGVLAKAPSLRAVFHAAGSVKSLVSDELWERGIRVSSAADANAGPVIAYTTALITLAARRTLTMSARYSVGWPEFTTRGGADGRTIGIIGASRIGRGVINALIRSEAEFRVLVSDPYLTDDEARRLGVERVNLAELCQQSSVVSVHAPLLVETTGLLDADMLALIPDGAAIINTARGAIIDTPALTAECASGRLEAYLDVTDPEPLPAEHPLISLPNVLVTPHIAGAQGSEVQRLGQYAVQEAERWAAGKALWGEVTRDTLAHLA